MTGASPSRAGNSTLSRLVSFSSRPWSSHLPVVPSASRAASSSVGRAAPTVGRAPPSRRIAGLGRPAGRCATARRARPPPRRSCARSSPTAGGPRGPSPGSACVVVLVEQQPLLLARSAPCPSAARARSGPPASRPARSKCRSPFSMAVGGSSPSAGVPRAPVPHDHVAAAVLALGDDALEVEVLERVVLDVDGQPAGPGVERRALRHGPADQHAVDLEPEVVVQAPGPVALHDEPVAALGARRPPGSVAAPGCGRSRAWPGRSPACRWGDGSPPRGTVAWLSWPYRLVTREAAWPPATPPAGFASRTGSCR